MNKRKKAEEEARFSHAALRQAREIAEAANETKSRFLA